MRVSRISRVNWVHNWRVSWVVGVSQRSDIPLSDGVVRVGNWGGHQWSSRVDSTSCWVRGHEWGGQAVWGGDVGWLSEGCSQNGKQYQELEHLEGLLESSGCECGPNDASLMPMAPIYMPGCPKKDCASSVTFFCSSAHVCLQI